jgi:hypothetical protein
MRVYCVAAPGVSCRSPERGGGTVAHNEWWAGVAGTEVAPGCRELGRRHVDRHDPVLGPPRCDGGTQPGHASMAHSAEGHRPPKRRNPW